MTPALNSVHCADAIALCRELPEASVDLIATDPPYGVTSCRWDKKIPLDAMWDAFRRIIKPRGAIVMTASQPFTSELVMSNREMFKYCWYYEKAKGSNIIFGPYRPLSVIEDVVVFSKGVATYVKDIEPMNYFPQISPKKYYRDFRGNIARGSQVFHSSISNIDQKQYNFTLPRNLLYGYTDADGRIHPTQKPVALFEYLIKTYTRPGDLVVDPFCGSGTTAVAARNTGRNYIVGDFLQEYVDITNKRLSAPFTPPLFDLDAPAAPKAETLPLPFDEAE